jgi:hypothetical protein
MSIGPPVPEHTPDGPRLIPGQVVRRLTASAMPARVVEPLIRGSGACRITREKRRSHERRQEVSPSKGHRPSRRTMLRLGLLAIPATQMPLGFVPHAAAQGTKLGANLIGKLEGAEVVTDPALFPKSFKEAPQLAELVKAGKLPPVRSESARIPWSSSRCARSGNTAAHGAGASPAPSTRRTATGSPRTTSCSTTTTRAPSSFRISRAPGRSARTARSPRSSSAAG